MKRFFSISVFIWFVLILTTAQSQIVWQQLEGPYGGSIRKIIDAYDNNVIALTSSFAYKSSDKGLNWTRIDNGIFFPLDLYFFNGKVFGISQYGNSSENFLYISLDTMKTWTKKSNGLENLIIQKIRLIGTELFACTNKGVYKSINNSESWTKAFELNGIQYTFIYDISFNSKGTIFLSTIAGLYRSKDNGINWQLMNPLSDIMNSNIENIVIDNEDKIYLNVPQGMFRSYDDGDTWTNIGVGTMDGNLGFLLNPSKGELIAGKLWGGIFTSKDYGDNWTNVTNNAAQSMLITDEGEYLAGSTNGIYFAESLTSNWEFRNQGINETVVTSIFTNKTNTAHKDDIIVGNENGSIYKSSDAGLTWNQVFQSQGSMISSISEGKNNWLFASSIWGGIARSSDFGNTWENANQGLDDPDIRALVVDIDGNLYAGSFSDIYKSTDNGSNWTVCLTLPQSIQCSSLAINNKKMIFAGTLVYGVLRTTDNGATWTQMVNGLPFPIPYLTINKSNQIFASASNGNLYKSVNDGANWTLVRNGVGILNMLFINDNDILASVDQNHEVVGIQRSKDQGTNWLSEQKGIENIFVYSFDANSSGEILAGSSFGVFRTDQPIVSVDEKITDLEDFIIYPNPATEFISIPEYSGEIKIFDMMGKELIKVNSIDKQIIDIRSLKSGIYLIKIAGKVNKFVKI